MSISPMKLGAKGNGAADDHLAIQTAVNKAASTKQWVDGGFRTYALSKPVMLPQSARIRSLTLKALGGYPVDETSAMLMTARSLQKLFLADVTVDGANVPGVNGIFASLQQASELRRLRIDNCKVGYRLEGQQALHSNLEIIGCGQALSLGEAWFMWFFGTNIEQCAVGIELPNAHNCGFWGLHMEACGISIHFPPGAGARAIVFDSPHIPAGNSVVCESDSTNYEIRNWMPQGDATLIVDKARGYTITNAQWGDGYGWESSFVQRRGQVPPLMQVRDAA